MLNKQNFVFNQNEEEINKETENINTTIMQLTDELEKRQSMADELKSQLNMIVPAVPEDILTILWVANSYLSSYLPT